MFQSIREELDIRIWYDDKNESIELNGHEDGIKRAKHRLGKLIEQDITVIRVKSKYDKCGQIIGKGGVMINKIGAAQGYFVKTLKQNNRTFACDSHLVVRDPGFWSICLFTSVI